jgi:hypothetical protein
MFDRELVGLHSGQYDQLHYGSGWRDYEWNGAIGNTYLELDLYTGIPYIPSSGRYAFPKGDPCGQFFGNWETLPDTYNARSYYWDTTEGQIISYASGSCPGGSAYVLDFSVWNSVDTACRQVATGGAQTNTFNSSITTYLYDTKAREWKTVRSDSAYYPADPLMQTREDCSQGSVVFAAFLDAFTNWGATSKTANDGTNLYDFGSPNTLYPIDDETQFTDSGWVGIPFPIDDSLK